MLRLHQHVLRQFALITLFSIIIFALCGYFLFRHIEITRYENLLKTTINTIQISSLKLNGFQNFADNFANSTNLRVTLIDDNGTVLGDSAADAKTMENHNNREEIIAAWRGEFGVSLRYSDTLKSDFLYVAKKITIEGAPYFIRVTAPLKFIQNSFYIAFLSFFVIFALILFFNLFWAGRFNKNIKNEVLKIESAFVSLAEKNYQIDENFGFAREFVQIGVRLKKLAKKLAKKDKLKRKYTAKIKLAAKQKSDIISAISHEFKNPIASVIGYAQTLNDDTNIDAEVRAKFLSKILKNSQKISDMIDRLSLASKLESGDVKVVWSEFDLNSLVAEIVASFAVAHAGRTILFEGEPTIVKADAQMIDTAVSNLIANALKYSENEVAVSLKDGVLSVHDSGIGIAADEIGKITDKFYRVEAHSWNNSLGLGLTFVTYILKLHSSKLTIESELGKGSTFSFALPKN